MELEFTDNNEATGLSVNVKNDPKHSDTPGIWTIVADESWEIRYKDVSLYAAFYLTQTDPSWSSSWNWDQVGNYFGIRNATGYRIAATGNAFNNFCNETTTGFYVSNGASNKKKGCFWWERVSQPTPDPAAIARSKQEMEEYKAKTSQSSLLLAEATSEQWQWISTREVQRKLLEMDRLNRKEKQAKAAAEEMKSIKKHAWSSAAESVMAEKQSSDVASMVWDSAKTTDASLTPDSQLPKEFDWTKEMSCTEWDDLGQEFNQGECGKHLST